MTRRVVHRTLSKFGYELRKKRYDGVTGAWPTSETDPEIVDIPALLLLTLPFSGSTAIARLLCQTGEVAGLRQDCEGQWLLPGMCSEDRWLPEKYIHYPSVAGVWSKKIAALRAEQPKLRYLIEKSPPNMMRYNAIVALFPECRIVANNRNPFAAIASISGRKWSGAQSSMDAEIGLRIAAHDWLTRSRQLKCLCLDHDISLINYESFCKDPSTIFKAFGLDHLNLKTDVDVSVKDYAPNGIQNMNARQVDKLSARDQAIITEILAPQEDLLEFFGYTASIQALT